MSEYISKEAAYAKMDKLIERAATLKDTAGQHDYSKAWYAIEEIPAADVAPIVRCASCSQYNREGCCVGFGWCIHLDTGVTDEFYCKAGETNRMDAQEADHA